MECCTSLVGPELERLHPAAVSAPPGGIRHPLDLRALPTPDADTVVVATGTWWGRFPANGEHVKSPLFDADPELCRWVAWVASPRPSTHHRLSRLADLPAER